MLSAVAWLPIAEASTVMYPPLHGGCCIGWPATPRSPPSCGGGAGACVVAAGVGAAVGGGAGGAVGGGAGGAVGATVVGLVGAAVGATVAGTSVVEGIGSGVVDAVDRSGGTDVVV